MSDVGQRENILLLTDCPALHGDRLLGESVRATCVDWADAARSLPVSSHRCCPGAIAAVAARCLPNSRSEHLCPASTANVTNQRFDNPQC